MTISSRLYVMFLFMITIDVGGKALYAQETNSAQVKSEDTTLQTSIRIVSRQEITAPGEVLSLSPDSQLILVKTLRTVCLYTFPTFAEYGCLPKLKGGIDFNNMNWSPDGSQLAFTEYSSRTFVDSDIWVFKAQTKTLDNVTDDNFTGNLVSSEEDVPDVLDVDLVPTWLPENQGIMFGRSTLLKGQVNGTDLYHLSLNTQALPEKFLVLDEEKPMTIWSRMFFLSKRNALLYVVDRGNQKDALQGVWMVELEQRQPQQLLSFVETELGRAFLIDVSEKEDMALLWHSNEDIPSGVQSSKFSLLDLSTGSLFPVRMDFQEPQESFPGVSNAVFSPDGSYLLYTYQESNEKSQLVVRHLREGADRVLWTYTGAPLGGAVKKRGVLDWGPQHVVYVSTGSAESGVLVMLREERMIQQSAQEKLEGTWIATVGNDRSIFLTFSPQNKFEMRLGQESISSGMYTVDWTKNPAHLNLDAGEFGTLYTIIEFIDEGLRIEDSDPGEERPEQFSEEFLIFIKQP